MIKKKFYFSKWLRNFPVKRHFTNERRRGVLHIKNKNLAKSFKCTLQHLLFIVLCSCKREKWVEVDFFKEREWTAIVVKSKRARLVVEGDSLWHQNLNGENRKWEKTQKLKKYSFRFILFWGGKHRKKLFYIFYLFDYEDTQWKWLNIICYNKRWF